MVGKKCYPAIDVNVRFTMSTYLSEIEKKFGNDRAYLSVMRDINTRTSLSYDKIQDVLCKHNILFSPKSKRGIFVYVSGTLPKYKLKDKNYFMGRVYSLIIGDDYPDCMEIKKKYLYVLDTEIKYSK